MSLAERLAKAERPDRIQEVRSRIQERLVEVLGPALYDAAISEKELRDLVHKRLRELLDEEEVQLSIQEKGLITRQIGDSIASKALQGHSLAALRKAAAREGKSTTKSQPAGAATPKPARQGA